MPPKKKKLEGEKEPLLDKERSDEPSINAAEEEKELKSVRWVDAIDVAKPLDT